MPSSGLPMESLIKVDMENEEMRKIYVYVTKQAMHAVKLGMFTEWLESFLGAWNSTHDPIQAANAGIIEWDM